MTEIENVVENTEGVENASISSPDAHAENESVITAPKRKRAPKSSTKANDDGVIGSALAEAQVKSEVEEEPVKEAPGGDKVALYSERNIRWGTFGSLTKGYNIVTKEAAARWLTRPVVREATPEEVAAHYGK